MLWLAACAADPAVDLGPRQVCADPGAREAQPYDEIVIADAPADEDRFWGAGVVAADLDQDGDIDLFVPGPHGARLLRNDGGDLVDDPAALPDLDWERTVGAVAADVDGDDDLDLVVTRWGPEDWLLLGDHGRFSLAPSPLSIPSHSQSASLADAEGDGDLDLAIAGHGEVQGGDQISVDGPADPTRLWLNDGDGGFVDGSDALAPEIRDGYTYVVGWTDLDADGRPDWIVANDYPVWIPTLGAYQAGARWTVADDRGLGWAVAGMGLGLADVNGDGAEDLLLAAWDRLVAPVSTVGGPWVDRAEAVGLVPPPHDGDDWVGWGAEWADLDDDGRFDAVVAYGHLDTVGDVAPGGGSAANALDQRFGVYHNDGARFSEVAVDWGLGQVGVWRGFVVVDLDGNGWPDVVRRDLDGRIVVDRARCGDAAWLTVEPRPLVDAVGAEITVWAGDLVLHRTIHAGGTSLASGGPPEALFGLGSADQVDRVEVRWPDGATTEVGPLRADRRLVVRR